MDSEPVCPCDTLGITLGTDGLVFLLYWWLNFFFLSLLVLQEDMDMDWKSARLFKLYYKIRKLFYNMRLFIHVCSLYLCWPAVTVTIGWLPYVDSSIVLLDYLKLKLKIYEIKWYTIFSQTFNMPHGFRYLWYNIRLWWFPCLELWNNILDLYVLLQIHLYLSTHNEESSFQR